MGETVPRVGVVLSVAVARTAPARGSRAVRLLLGAEVVLLAVLLLCRLIVAVAGGSPEAFVEDVVVIQVLGVAGWFSAPVFVPAGLLVVVLRGVARDWVGAVLVLILAAALAFANAVLGVWLVFPEGIDFGP